MINKEFETKALGRCKILEYANNNALIEKMYDATEKYIIAMGYNEKDNTWRSGIYHTDLCEAFDEFTDMSLLVNDISTETVEKYINEVTEQMKELRDRFEEITLKDKNLIEHFKDDNPKDRFSHIQVAGAILAGTALRNARLKDGEIKEEIPYTKEQVAMIDEYIARENSIQSIEDFMELNNVEEMEY